jgi:hypothetical protein
MGFPGARFADGHLGRTVVRVEQVATRIQTLSSRAIEVSSQYCGGGQVRSNRFSGPF